MASLTLEERFVELRKAKEFRPRNPRPKIQRVANHLRNREHFAKHYSPKLVSIGPIHHGDANLELGEKYKLMWAAKYIENTGRNPKDLHKRIADKLEELKGLFAADVLLTNNIDLSWILFVDGCALLQILEKAKLDKPDEMDVKVDQLVLVMQDVLLLENQIPYLVLKLLWRDDNESMLIETMKEFLHCHHWTTTNSDSKSDKRKKQDKQENHLTSKKKKNIMSRVYRMSHPLIFSIFIVESSCRNLVPSPFVESQAEGNKANEKKQNPEDSNENNSSMITTRNIEELRAVGIRLKSSKTRKPRDVYFSHGWLAAELTLPEIVVDDTTAATIFNLTAYQMCPDFENDYGICSFAAFMDSLIDYPEDVKALRLAGILHNSLGSDEEVAKLFNIISTDLVPNPLTYYGVRTQIDKHYKNKWKTWIVMDFHTYFSNLWVIIAFHAALLAIALTFVRTWLSIHPTNPS